MPRYFTCSSVRVEARERCLSPSLTSRPDRWQICGLARLGREERLRSLRDHCRAVVVGCQHHGTLTVRYAAHPSLLRAHRGAKLNARARSQERNGRRGLEAKILARRLARLRSPVAVRGFNKSEVRSGFGVLVRGNGYWFGCCEERRGGRPPRAGRLSCSAEPGLSSWGI